MQNKVNNQENVLVNQWGFTKMSEGNYYKNSECVLILLSFDNKKISCVNIGKHNVLSHYNIAENEQAIDVLSRLELLMAVIRNGFTSALISDTEA